MASSPSNEIACTGATADRLAGLNEAQRAAVLALDGPSLILAGAGTGKTRVLTARLAHIVESGRAASYQILAVTFTNKAAREMNSRVAEALGDGSQGVLIGTFHSVASRILRQNAELVGLKSNFTILDSDDQQRLLVQIIRARGLDEKKFPAKAILGGISEWKDRGLTPAQVAHNVDGTLAEQRLVLYRDYQERLLHANACDFGDLLLHNLTVLTNHAEVLQRYRDRFRYILVDEYQDSNVVQYLWLRLLATSSGNLCCVGDEDQSIYSWRGAQIRNILSFEKDYPTAQIFRLEQNYRSTGHILATATHLIAHNNSRLGKTLHSILGDGEKVRIIGLPNDEEEARHVSGEIERLRAANPHVMIAVLVRAGFQTRRFEERFTQIGMGYRIIGGLRYYDRLEIRDAISYFRMAVQQDDDLAFERILGRPKRGIGAAVLQALHVRARKDGCSLCRAAGAVLADDALRTSEARSLRRFIDQIESWRGLLGNMHHCDAAERILEESGYTDFWKSEYAKTQALDIQGRLENLRELIVSMRDFASMPDFLEHVGLIASSDGTEASEQRYDIQVMTLHASKGLEFDTVFLPGWEEGLLPHQRAVDQGGADSLEEERRLAYVGLTRARHLALISFAASRRRANYRWDLAHPSRFLHELPEQHVDWRGPHRTPVQRRSRVDTTFESDDGWSEQVEPHSSVMRAEPVPTRTFRSVRPLQKMVPVDDPEIGMKVRHARFGPGEIIGGEQGRLRVRFHDGAERSVLSSFLIIE